MPETFVILHHSGCGPDHYDLMLETDQALATWRLCELPDQLSADESTQARRLADHRLAYLDYEGPISGGRGRVERMDKGDYELLHANPACWQVRLSGRRLRGRFELRRSGGETDHWTLRRLNDD